MLEFERALQAADRAAGGDGPRPPVLDWTDVEGPVVLPTFCRTLDFPADLLPAGATGRRAESDLQQLAQRGYKEIQRGRTDDQLRFTLKYFKNQVDRALSQPQHQLFASTEGGDGKSIESPHNSLHTAVGFPMSSIPYASYHPLFFLHHANVDRQYEAYLLSHPQAAAQFEASQRAFSRRTRATATCGTSR